MYIKHLPATSHCVSQGPLQDMKTLCIFPAEKAQLQPGVLERRVGPLCFTPYKILKSFLFFWVIWSNVSNTIRSWMAGSRLCTAPEVPILQVFSSNYKCILINLFHH